MIWSSLAPHKASRNAGSLGGGGKSTISMKPGATAKFQSQAFKVARYYLRKKVEGNDVVRVDWTPASGTRGIWNDSSMKELGTDLKRMGAPPEGEIMRRHLTRTWIMSLRN